MRYMILSVLLISSLFSMQYYAKLEPINTYIVKSSVSGKVVFSNEGIEGFKANNSIIIKIDSSVNILELKYSQEKLNSYDQMIKIEENNYKRLSKISSRSVYEKDNQKIKVLNLQSQRTDLLVKIANLKDTIKNKKLLEKDVYIYNIAVKKGDYVNPGTVLYEAKDLSSAKVEIFIPISDVNIIKDKKVFLNDKESDIKINKIYKVADSKHISSYKVEFIIPTVKNFSTLVKIEFK